MYCKICGETRGLKNTRFWSPDDGWVIGKLCPYCKATYGGRKPERDDYAFESVVEYCNEAESEMEEIETYLLGRAV